MKRYLLLIIGLVLLSGLTRKFFGLRPFTEDYAIGYNVGVIISYIVGIVLIVAFFKKSKTNKSNARNEDEIRRQKDV